MAARTAPWKKPNPKKRAGTSGRLSPVAKAGAKRAAKKAGRKYPSLDTIVKISEFFGISTDYLLKDSIPIEAAEKIVAGMPDRPAIRYEGSKAYYNSATDQITLPPRELFTSAEEFYGTLGHECLHASGHQSRLNRESITEAAPFGSPVYCREELIAEMGAAFLCAEAGISPVVLENQAA